MNLNNKQLVAFLKEKIVTEASFTDKLKIAYRPYICPFADLLNELEDNASVFDVGCGSGMFLSLVQEFKKPSRIAGIEIDPKLIENAKQVLKVGNGDSNFLSVFDGKQLPDEISEFDYVYMIDVFHHIPVNDQYEFLTNLINKMKKGAYLVFKDINGASIFKFWNKFHDLLLAGEIGNEAKRSTIEKFFKEQPVRLISKSQKQMLLYPHFTITVQKQQV
jgi:2-polyprenyl-3-methyl-5-hydroxy-6-metoxy-1,4-benzoquinol methylase